MRTALAIQQRRLVTPHDVRAVVGRFLHVDPDGLDAARSLASYGVDSLSAMELVAELEDAFGRRLPEWLLAEHPTLSALIAVIAGGDQEIDAEPAMMRADCELPADIRPCGPAPGEPPRHVLLTGATGFLGSAILPVLLEDPDVRVTCLVRARGGDPQLRLLECLSRDSTDLLDGSRVDVAAGDLALARLGLDDDRYDELARSIDAIYHVGADVNWVSSYTALRAPNVLGTRELLRLACEGRSKAVHFVSSMSVCYATDGPPTVGEGLAMTASLESLPLGYAQSKCVSEALVGQASARGLRTRIYRPALIAGDGRTGRSNVDDLTARVLKGCIEMGAAPDLDWCFDALPVDYAARAIVSLGGLADTAGRTVHLTHPRPRHWRECVLWARFFGYPMQLEPFERWRERLARESATSSHALHGLRPFFLRTVDGRQTAAELLEVRRRSRVSEIWSRDVQRRSGLECPPIDAELMAKYFEDYVRQGLLPDRPRPRRAHTWSRTGEIAPALRTHFQDQSLDVREARLLQAGSNHSILGELLSWRHGRAVGVAHYRLDLRGARCPDPYTFCHSIPLDVVLKSKASDEDVLDAAEMTADVCDAELASNVRRFRDVIGIRQSHVRELALYELGDERLTQHMPLCYGTWRKPDERSWGLVLERLADVTLIDASDSTRGWTSSAIAAAIDGLAVIHSAWLGRDAELRAQPWIGHVASSGTAIAMTPLWRSLALHAAPRFERAAGESLVRVHMDLATSVADWWPTLERGPRTLVHNDFNSRNIALRRMPSGLKLVAYDWELATLGAPQRDLAELLCFVLPPTVGRDRVTRWVEHHRRRLEEASGISLPRAAWRAGFASALAELLINRLAFYALIDRVSAQPFLTRVLRTWSTLAGVCAQWNPALSGLLGRTGAASGVWPVS